MLDDAEIRKLKAACLKLRKTSVQEEEEYVTHDPILILMSTVLSLNRRWYSHALPARQYFEAKVYPSLAPKTLDGLRAFIFRAGSNRDDWVSVALALWNRREWDKARMLSDLADYFVGWHQKQIAAASEIVALRKWASSTNKDDFLGEIKGLGPRTHEQLLWYLDGKKAIKFDRHVASFVSQLAARLPTRRQFELYARLLTRLAYLRLLSMREYGTTCNRVVAIEPLTVSNQLSSIHFERIGLFHLLEQVTSRPE